jgi:DNA-binding XRE family transcriptional regulator
MARIKFSDVKKEALKNPKVKAEYDRLTPEFEFRSKLIGARLKAGLTQEQVAEKMGTSKTAVSRMESATSKTMPSVKTLMKFADAVGMHLKIDFIK